MTTSQAEFDAEGVELRASVDNATGTVIRRFRAFERLHHRRQQINTMHFCVAAEVACDLESSALCCRTTRRSAAPPAAERLRRR
jgi:hypothetical protein